MVQFCCEFCGILGTWSWQAKTGCSSSLYTRKEFLTPWQEPKHLLCNFCSLIWVIVAQWLECLSGSTPVKNMAALSSKIKEDKPTCMYNVLFFPLIDVVIPGAFIWLKPDNQHNINITILYSTCIYN